MPDLDIDSLLAPLPGPAGPCGVDLEYDPAFAAMAEAAAGKPERQYGETVIPAEPPDWPAVREQALALASRTRDLRVAVWLTRSSARVEGFVGAARGLKLLAGLVERHWDGVHPLLDASDRDDPTARLNALYPLHHGDGLADLRAATLMPGRGSITVRGLELAFGHAEPRAGEPVPTAEGATLEVAAAQARSAELSAAMTGAHDAARILIAVLDRQLGGARSPDLSPLVALLQSVATAGERASGRLPAAANNAPAGNGAPAIPVRAIGAIQSREDAIRTLERVCEWIESNEPTNPAPLLILRAQRLMKKNFMEIIRDLVPDGVGQIEKLAGLGSGP